MQGPMAAAIVPGAERLHGGDSRLQHARDRAAPAGVGGADHAGCRVAKQDGRAIGGDDAEGDAGAVGHHGVGAGPLPAAQAAVAMTTSAPCTWVRPSRAAGSAPIARAARARFSSTASRAILAGQAAVQAGEGAGGNAAQPGEEAVRRGQHGGAKRVWQHAGQSANPGGVGQAGWQSARALNRRPMRSGSARRWAASIRAAARRGGWPRARRSVRWNRPRRARNGPCGMGPCTVAPAAAAMAARAGSPHGRSGRRCRPGTADRRAGRWRGPGASRPGCCARGRSPGTARRPVGRCRRAARSATKARAGSQSSTIGTGIDLSPSA